MRVVGGSIEIEHIIDPSTLTISGETELCGDVTAYNKIEVTATGVLLICAKNATSSTGYVNISLGDNGNFTLFAGGRIEGAGRGARGGAGSSSATACSTQGENGFNFTLGGTACTANGGGGSGANRAGTGDSIGGGGGAFGGGGGKGGYSAADVQSVGGNTYGNATDQELLAGSGGGGESGDNTAGTGPGSAGGAGLKINAGAGSITIKGTINMSGGNGTNGDATDDSGGGGGSGGHVILKAKRLDLGSGTIWAYGARGGNAAGTSTSDSCGGGGGGGGRILYIYQTITATSLKNSSDQGFNGAGTDGACDQTSDAGVATSGGNGTVFYDTTSTFPIIDQNPPNITLLSPTNNSQTGVSNNWFVAHFIDDRNVSNATLYIYNSTNKLIGTNFTGAGNSSITINISFDLNYTGTFYWNYLAVDNASDPTSNQAFNNSNLTLVYEQANSAPQIIMIYNHSEIGGALNEGPASTNFTVNFSVVDTDGASDLNSATASINLTKSGEDVRYNSTCAQYQSSGNNANYSCLVKMWWWDGSGTWKIGVNISDAGGATAVNNSVAFSVSETIGFVLAPQNLTWATLTIGASNQTASNDPLLLNNTGNKDIQQSDISINATNLAGEADSSKALYSGNFSVGNATGSSFECNYAPPIRYATRLNFTVSGGSFVNITSAIMNASNFSLNNGREGQEQLYFCLLLVGNELTQQSYSTRQNGPWTVQILLAAFAIAGGSALRKRKKNRKITEENILDILEEKIKDKYKITLKELLTKKEEIKEIQIPLDIFNQNIAPSESLSKYLRENLGMKFNEIAVLLNRSQKTIALNYRNAIKKKKEKIKVNKETILLPLNILSNRNLSVLESVVYHLREKGMKNSEIARMLNKDTRNTWTLYKRAIKKKHLK